MTYSIYFYVSVSALFAMYNCQTDCETLCSSVQSCAADPHEHSSYCKSWQSPSVCFGLYWTDASMSSMCFQPNNASCPETLPVTCESNSTSTTTTISAATTNVTTDAPTTTNSLPVISSVEIVNNTQPSGAYCGTYNFDTISLGTRMDFNATVVGLDFSGLLSGNISNVPFIYSVGVITVDPTVSYVDFLNDLPYKLVPADIVLGFKADTVSASVLGMVFDLTPCT